MAELAGVMVGNYFLLECLGREGMVETYRARPTTRGGYDVVLRIFRPAFPDPTDFQAHFAAEVEKVWRCHHEHIQPLIEFGAGDDLLYSATQLTDAETLGQFLSRWEREHDEASLPLPLVVRFMLQICAALQVAHEHQIVHGNIQPSSILVPDIEHLQLTNFSMKRIHEESDPVIAQVEEGNTAYVAPEQAIGMLSPASDIYTVGVLLFLLLAGRPPYEGESAGEIALKHANEPIPSLHAERPDVPEAVELVMRVALAKSPAGRFPTITALADALMMAIQGDQPPVVPATPPTPPTSSSPRRIRVHARRTAFTWSRAFTLISILVVLSGLVGILLFFAAIPFHLEELPILPFQNLGQSGGIRVNPGGGLTPTPTSGTDKPSAPSTVGYTGNPSSPSGHNTPTTGITPLPTTNVTVTPNSTSTPTPVVCITGSLLIDGSPYLEPALQQITHDYGNLCSGLNLLLRGDGTRALNFVQKGRVDIAASDVTALTTRNLTDHPLAALLYAVIASPDVSISGLTSAEIQGIFTGHITNWSQVGGPDETINVILPPPTAAINAILHTYVLNGMPEQARGFVMKRDRPDILAQYVSQTPGAISYVPLAVANTASVQTLSIDGVAPSTQALLAGTYQFWSVEHLYTQGNGTSQAQAFLQFADSSQEMSVLSQFGAVPIGMVNAGILSSHLPGPQF